MKTNETFKIVFDRIASFFDLLGIFLGISILDNEHIFHWICRGMDFFLVCGKDYKKESVFFS